MRASIVALFLVASSGIAHAACDDPQSNYEMKICAEQDWKAAEVELEAAFAKAIAAARENDATAKGMPGSANRPSSEALLRKAQLAWIGFRNANCDYQYQIYFGGSHAELAYLLCKKDMTKARVKDLRQLPGGDEFEP